MVRRESELGKHMVVRMMAEDLTLRNSPGSRTAVRWACLYLRAPEDYAATMLPILPVTINTYFPPNQPTAARCYAFGKALRRAIESWDSTKRVAVVASGGLSHFVVDEELDRGVLKAMREHDEKVIGSFESPCFNPAVRKLKIGLARQGPWST